MLGEALHQRTLLCPCGTYGDSFHQTNWIACHLPLVSFFQWFMQVGSLEFNYFFIVGYLIWNHIKTQAHSYIHEHKYHIDHKHTFIQTTHYLPHLIYITSAHVWTKEENPRITTRCQHNHPNCIYIHWQCHLCIFLVQESSGHVHIFHSILVDSHERKLCKGMGEFAIAFEHVVRQRNPTNFLPSIATTHKKGSYKWIQRSLLNTITMYELHIACQCS